MKKIIFLVFAFCLSASSFSQQTTRPQPQTKEYYFKRCDNQKTAAWVLLGGGATLSTVGLLIGVDRMIDEIGANFNGSHDGGFTTGAVLFYTGIASMLGSVPLFIASSRNRRNALAVTAVIKMEDRSLVQQGSIIKTAYPALGIRIRI